MSYYEILGVQSTATSEEIRAAYLVAVRKAHPDKANSREESTAYSYDELQSAYETLRDPVARKRYDDDLKRGHSKPVIMLPEGKVRPWEVPMIAA